MTVGHSFHDKPFRTARGLHRHLTVLADLLPRDGTGAEPELLVVTASWSGGPEPVPREAELAGVLPAADHWTSILTDDSMPAQASATGSGARTRSGCQPTRQGCNPGNVLTRS